MRTYVYFVRHAEAESNVNPFFPGSVNGLTDKGREQANALAERFKNVPIHAIYCSDVLRAKQTAEVVASAVGLVPIEQGFLQERTVVFTSPTEYRPDEAFAHMLERLKAAKVFLESREEKYIVIVSHAIFLRSLSAYLMLGEMFTEKLSDTVSDSLIIDHASVSKWMFNHDKRVWRLQYWNDQSHLA